MNTDERSNDQTRRTSVGESASARILREVRQAQEAEDTKREQLIAQAISENPDKEPFDVDRLRTVYAVGEEATGSDLAQLRGKYYLGFPSATTLAEFGEQLTWLDHNESN
ncbi:hypothetical protein KBD20_00950 [Candidatus Saccharibacteria bacterium]|nr:hypothetical protein [Candidatus Saccharibacteria bacterium]